MEVKVTGKNYKNKIMPKGDWLAIIKTLIKNILALGLYV